MYEDSSASDSDEPEERRKEAPVVAEETKKKRTKPAPPRPPRKAQKRSELVSKVAKSFAADNRRPEAAEAARTAEAPASHSHWTAEAVASAKWRAATLHSNPGSRDGRAAYERPSLHGSSVVVSVGPSSLPKSCRVTMGKIPKANYGLPSGGE
mmetsp:Transcript_7591/g.23454  ORF Transcript_7591/g.23454 Transcript_7591/m.23454 type:complete len:153 (-) Transcript_7591:41-499(-)